MKELHLSSDLQSPLAISAHFSMPPLPQQDSQEHKKWRNYSVWFLSSCESCPLVCGVKQPKRAFHLDFNNFSTRTWQSSEIGDASKTCSDDALIFWPWPEWTRKMTRMMLTWMMVRVLRSERNYHTLDGEAFHAIRTKTWGNRTQVK